MIFNRMPNVLFVDDEPDLLTLGRLILEKDGELLLKQLNPLRKD